MLKNFALTFSACVLLVSAARADTADDLQGLVGYTVVAVKTVEAFRDKDGKRNDSFEGCDWDRVIIFTDGTAVRCTTYSYSYSYRPRAAILSNGTDWKMIVGSNIYSVSRDLR